MPAAQRGTIDAAEWIGPADDRNLGLHTIWKNYYLQGLHQSTDIGEVIFNKTWWNKQPADVQEILRGAALASMIETYSFNVYRNAQAIVELREKHGVQILDTPKEFYPEFVRATNVVLDRYAAKDPFFKEVLDSQRDFAKTVVPYWTKIPPSSCRGEPFQRHQAANVVGQVLQADLGARPHDANRSHDPTARRVLLRSEHMLDASAYPALGVVHSHLR